MSNFAIAFAGGIQLAKESADARAEVSRIFAELKLAILAETNDVIEIERVPLTATLDSVSRIAEFLKSNPERTYAIAAHRSGALDRWTRLADWVPSDDGFPCVVGYADQRNTCMDGTALATVLSNMLAHPNTGRKILELLEAEEAKASAPDRNIGPAAQP